MYKIFIAVTLFLKAVAPHGGHNEGQQTRNAIQDAMRSYLCRGANGLPCNGHGSCSYGICTCYHGYGGLKCQINDADTNSFGHAADTSGSDVNVGGFSFHDLISPDIAPQQVVACFTNDDNACSGHGICNEGSCLCESGHSGRTCELTPKKGFCLTYKECAECTAFMNDCPEKCSLMANFKLVFGFNKERDGPTFRQCRFRNSDHNCTFYFKQQSESSQGMKTIFVKACMNYNEATTHTNDSVEQLKDTPLLPITSPQPTSISTNDESNTGMDSHDTHSTHSHGDHAHGTMGDAGKQDSNKGDSGSNFVKPEMLLVAGSILMLLQI